MSKTGNPLNDWVSLACYQIAGAKIENIPCNFPVIRES
jgi:hypothetical protein